MRILLGYTDTGLHPDTVPALLPSLASAGLHVDLMDVSSDDFAYWREIEKRWDGTEDLLIIEQDTVVHDQVIPQLLECSQPWCVFPYPIFNSNQRLTQGLGCTRFSAALQAEIPAAEFAVDGALRDIGTKAEGVPWQFLDLVIAERLRIGHNLRPHVHTPDVEHRHDYSGPPSMPRRDGSLRHPGEPTEDPGDSPLAVYHRPVPVMFDPGHRPPAIQVFGASMTPVGSPDDAARLANSLTQRYLNEDGSMREMPAQLDTDRPQPLRFSSDKVTQGYLTSYLKIAAEIGTAGRVCEVGVFYGESLRMWQALFPGGIVVGVDNNEQALWPLEVIKVVASQDDDDLPARLAAISGGYDLIVDDASHLGELTRITWELLWPLVVPGGWYVVEDWFVGYGQHPLFPGDHSMLRTAESFLALFAEPNGEVESVTYRHGMIIMRKAQGTRQNAPA